MKKLAIGVLIAICAVLAVSGLLSANENKDPETKEQQQQVTNAEPTVWAGISAGESLYFIPPSPPKIIFRFTIVNDTDKVFNPMLGKAKLVVNDVEQPVSLIKTGPADSRLFDGIPAGEYVTVDHNMGSLFKKPGIYSIYWKGEGYKSAPIVIRILQSKVPPAGY